MPAPQAEFPEVLDSTIMAAFRSCPRKAFTEFMQHYKLKDQSVHLHAGAAYASGIERARKAFYLEGQSEQDSVTEGVGELLRAYGAFECPDDSAKSASRMAGALEFYFSRYPLSTDRWTPIDIPGGGKGIEFSFTQPLNAIHPVSSDPLLYVGRMDMICTDGAMTLGEDDKTTSSLGASWSRQWDLRSQFTGYVWGAKMSPLQLKLDGFLVRGVSILKTKYDTQEAITYRPEWQLDRWEEQLYRDIKRMQQCWEEGYFDYNLDHACAEYGGCPFRSVCLSREPSAILEGLYERRKWNPVTRIESRL